MAFADRIRNVFLSTDLDVEDRERLTNILYTTIGAALTGLILIFAHRLIKLDFDQAPSILTESAALVVSLVMIRKGHLAAARAFSLLSLLVFLDYQCYKDDGIHDIALFAFPGLLMMAALVLKRRYFILYTGIALLFILLLGYLETAGIIRSRYSSETNLVRIIDLLAILAVTSVPIRLLADSYTRNFARVKRNEEDIRKQAGQLKESEHRYRALFDGANDAIFIICGERFVECNEMTLRMFGCETPSDIVGRNPWEFSPPLQPDGRNSKEKATEVIRAAVQGTPQRFYWKHSRKDGSLFDAEVSLNCLESGKDILVQAVVRDTTDRMRAEEALKESEERFRTLFESQGEGTGIVDSHERFILCNPAAEAILGVPPGGLTGRSLQEFVNPEQWALIQSQTAQRRHGNKSTYEMEVVRPDGKSRSITVTATPRFQGGEYVGAFGVFRDITEQKGLQSQLLQSQKIQSLGTLAGGIAHDINNILGIILGYSTKLKKGGLKPPETADSVNAINNAVGRGAALVQQILTFARQTEVATKAMSVPDLVRELVTMLERTFPKVISFKVSIDNDVPLIRADQTQIHQALLNLCLNARDAMPSGGNIVLAVSSVPGRKLKPRFPSAESDSYVRIGVTDTGTGMDRETKDRAFDPFFTTKEKGKGTGLGLSVVYGIVQSHHGFVDVESDVGRGTTLSLYLPVPRHSLQLEVGSERKGEVRGGSETILVVEDEGLIRELVRSHLESNGYKVLVASDGVQAVELYAQHQKEIALVFTDMGLPRMTGGDEFRKLKEINPDVRVVLAGGFLEPELKEELFKEGAKTFLQKPYDPEDVLSVVREVLDEE